MELEQEVYLLRQKFERVRASLPELKAAVVSLFAPRKIPRPEILIAVRWLASAAGLPSRCPNVDCRRTGLCAAGDPGDPACGSLWPDELSARMDDMVIGIVLSGLCAEARNAAIHARLQELMPVTAKAGRRRKTAP
jgi:hypothetical protein